MVWIPYSIIPELTSESMCIPQLYTDWHHCTNCFPHQTKCFYNYFYLDPRVQLIYNIMRTFMMKGQKIHRNGIVQVSSLFGVNILHWEREGQEGRTERNEMENKYLCDFSPVCHHQFTCLCSSDTQAVLYRLRNMKCPVAEFTIVIQTCKINVIAIATYSLEGPPL